VFWAQLSTGSVITQSDLDAWLTTFSDQYKTSFAASVRTEVSYLSAQAVLFAPSSSELLSVHTMTGSGGSSSGTPIPASAAACISWKANVYWRGGKPRTYLCGISGASTLNNIDLTAAFETALGTAAAGFLTAVNAITHTTISATALGFVSFFSGNALRSPSVFYPFVGSQVHSRIASQRRRLGPWTP
jgi:hypothetical protein